MGETSRVKHITVWSLANHRSELIAICFDMFTKREEAELLVDFCRYRILLTIIQLIKLS